MKLWVVRNDGGSSHQTFFWFNMDLANDITREAKNLIHMMELKLVKDNYGYKQG